MPLEEDIFLKALKGNNAQYQQYKEDMYKMAYGTMPAKKKPAAPLEGVVSFIIPYNKASASAKALAKALGLRQTSQGVGTPESKITGINLINWGNGKLEGILTQQPNTKIFNAVPGVNVTRNKLKLFKKIKESADPARVPEFFDNLDAAMIAVKKGDIVFGRSFTGSCGLDIVTFDENPDKFNSSDFWVVYKKKKSEFRIHIFKRNGEAVVIDRQQKTLRKTHPTTGEEIDKSKVNFMIRNHRNGFIFQRNDIKVPADVEAQALKAFKITGLDFGAVDVIWNEHEARAYVLEINTAPGLEGTTLDNYIAEFRNLGIGSEKTA